MTHAAIRTAVAVAIVAAMMGASVGSSTPSTAPGSYGSCSTPAHPTGTWTARRGALSATRPSAASDGVARLETFPVHLPGGVHS